MTNNDILRRLRHALNLSDDAMVAVYDLSGDPVTRSKMSQWLKRDDEDAFLELPDVALCRFLDGLVIEKRGPHPDGTIPKPLSTLSNNEILKKLRIALQLRDEDMIDVFGKVDFVVTKAELGSFFRKVGHRNYRPCPEQVLRKFLQGLNQKVA